MAISRFIIEKPYTQIVVGVWKEKLTRPSENGLKNHSVFYEYACKLILERISWYVDDNNGLVDITFSRWGSLVKADLQAHIAEKMKSRNCQIRPVFDVAKIEVLNMKDLVMLRFADNCASAIGNALNPDEYGELNYLCSNLLSPHLYRYRGRDHALWKYGVKVFPAEVSEKEFIERYPHTSKWFE